MKKSAIKKKIILKNDIFDSLTKFSKMINDSKEFDYIDLNDFGVNKIPISFISKRININNIVFLFAGDNNITNLTDLNKIPNLRVLDISDNPIKEIDHLPNKLEELVCRNCQITKICSHEKIKKIHCYGNKLVSLEKYPKLVDLKCDHNNLLSIQTYPSLKHLSCSNNPTTKIKYQPQLIFMDCTDTKMKSLEEIPLLKYLICQNTQLTDVSFLDNLERLEFAGSQIKSLPYLPKLKNIILDDMNLMISPNYKIISLVKYNKKSDIVFE